jgi:flagellar hook-basal body complex protein FliE
MSPLDALSALTAGGQGAINMPVTTTTPAVQGSPIGEGFQHMLDASPVSVSAPSAPSVSGDGPSTWGHMVQQMVMDANSQQQSATQKVADVLRGGPTPVHEAMVATEEASLSFTFLSEVRNKVVDAYQQVMQMQV